MEGRGRKRGREGGRGGRGGGRERERVREKRGREKEGGYRRTSLKFWVFSSEQTCMCIGRGISAFVMVGCLCL